MKTKSRRVIHNKTQKNPKKHKTLGTLGSVEDIYESRFSKKIKDHAENTQEMLIKLFNEETTRSTVRPQNDFYTYINYLWLQQKKKEYIKQQYYVEVDDFRITQNLVYQQLINIIQDYT